MSSGRAAAPRRILILSASVGAGHLRAAEALEAACRRRYPEAQVRNADALGFTPPGFRRLYAQGYVDFVNKAPELLGILYAATDRPPRHPAAERLRQRLERLNARPILKFVQEFAPDVVAHTHFLPAMVLVHEQRKRRFRAPQLVVVTDFDVHRFWLTPGVARYCVAREDAAWHLQALGEPRERLRVTGIPIDPVFAEPVDVTALRAKHGVDGTRPLVLVSCGGFGVGPVEGLVLRLAEALRGSELVVVAGRNEALRARLAARTERSATPVRVLGFTREMHEWMALATLLVSKPGGLTTSEALARGLPMVVVSPIPGQETRNAAMLYEEGAALCGENPLTVAPRVARLLATPGRLEAMRQAARRLGRPEAAYDCAQELGAILKEDA